MNSAKKFQYCTSKITFLSLRTKQIVDGWDVKKKILNINYEIVIFIYVAMARTLQNLEIILKKHKNCPIFLTIV